ncbi:MAG: polysaccharide lyase [Planctomycetaceae bacterium]|nr:polysaccharide lyase [Planctomycetaceae bacterium]
MNRSWIVAMVVLAWTSSQQPLLAEVIWRGDFETGDLSQWRGAPKSDGVHVITDIVREGRYAVRIDGTNAARRGDRDRIEFQHQPAPPGTAEGTERYFGWSVYLPQTFSRETHAVGYFESRNSWRQLMSWEVQGTDLLFTTRVPYARRWQGSDRLTPGRWHDFAVHVLWSQSADRGFVELWFDGEQVVSKTPTATLLDENVAFFQLGIMRATSATPETIFIDHIVEATTLAEVRPPAVKID